jgi:hypothetical protein
MRGVKFVGTVLAALITLAGLTLTLLVALHGFPFGLMDVDDSGFVSMSEVIASLDQGYRQEIIYGKKCVEIFSLKDGLPVKVICEE